MAIKEDKKPEANLLRIFRGVSLLPCLREATGIFRISAQDFVQ